MKGNQTGVAVGAREVEDGDDGGGGGGREWPCQPAFLKIKKQQKACATSRDKNKLCVPVLIIPHAVAKVFGQRD